jgi:hypothetical protein
MIAASVRSPDPDPAGPTIAVDALIDARSRISLAFAVETARHQGYEQPLAACENRMPDSITLLGTLL